MYLLRRIKKIHIAKMTLWRKNDKTLYLHYSWIFLLQNLIHRHEQRYNFWSFKLNKGGQVLLAQFPKF